MTLKAKAKINNITEEMEKVAESENVLPASIRQGLMDGTIVIPHNPNHKKLTRLCGVGKGLRTKVNANVGTSPNIINPQEELNKVKCAVASGADAVMDLSIGGDITTIRRQILKDLEVPLGTVPIYQAAIGAATTKGSIMEMTAESILKVIEEQAKDGVDFMTIHAGVTQQIIERLKSQERIMEVVSRGGSFLIEWMLFHQQENPLYQHFDAILDIAYEYDVVLSLGDGLRPGCLKDATDRPQIQELIILGELTKRAFEKDVQVMIEGPGHVPLNQIKANVLLEKRLCYEAPFYVLGPLVTDVAPGYDHIAGAIGGAIAGAAGADFLCYVTSSEHLRLPTVEDVREGVIVSRIAAHAADIAKGIPAALDWDTRMAKARKALDWQAQIELAIDPKKAGEYLKEVPPLFSEGCTMCGKYCAMKEKGFKGASKDKQFLS
ncbi:MAG: phosphomethylpyrimidine synthase ThiC [bacterium]|nr:phosphomethylpyrimidine synthase ThiC [bacterium]